MNSFELTTVAECNLGEPIGQCRAVPVRVGRDQPLAILVIHAVDFDIDPSPDMFFFPRGPLTLTLLSHEGEVLWRHPLGRGVVPGVWFCPVFPFDLDNDGVDEIWFVNNDDEQHPLNKKTRQLARIDALTGKINGKCPWPTKGSQDEMSFSYREFILGGHVHGQPVLVTAQGTYKNMYLQGWNSGMSQRWEYDIIRVGERRGAAGSHMSAVVDLTDDGVDEILWGERVLSMHDGKELFCAGFPEYHGHSDIVQPVWDTRSRRWFIFTARESHPEAAPRVVMFDDKGLRVWGDVEQGHMDMGWVARLKDDGSHIATAIRIGEKSCGPDGRFHEKMTEFAYDAATGKSVVLPFSTYRTLPVDLNGDGLHELVRGLPSGNGEVIDRHGVVIGNVGGPTALACQFLPRPGEHLLSYHADGVVRFWADIAAVDTPAAKSRYIHPFYMRNRSLTACGYNLINLGGL